MVKKLYVVTDLGPGDGGKGGVVHKISCMTRAHTILKVGGAQGSHGVSTSSGERFAFSQWGCGTFEGVRTHLTPLMVIAPDALLNEADALRYQHGIHKPFDLLTIDELALCATPYHGIASRLKELARKGQPRGTIGTGVGEAFRDAERYPALAIRAGDLARPNLADRLAAVREQVQKDLESILGGEFLSEDREVVAEETGLLMDDGFLRYNQARFKEVAKLARTVDHDYLRRKVFPADGTIVVECSHGILTDRFHGFHPYTSAIRTLPCYIEAMLGEAGYDGQVIKLGISRAYQIRHGAGPMPTADPAKNHKLLPGSHKETNRYQGEVRVGPLDLNLLRYAIEVCGGPDAFDGLAITWFDQVQANGAWHYCNRYQGVDNRTYFTATGGIKVRHGQDQEQLDYQEELGKQIFNCVPEISCLEVPPSFDQAKMFQLCSIVLKEKLSVSVRMVSFGPSELDKLCK